MGIFSRVLPYLIPAFGVSFYVGALPVTQPTESISISTEGNCFPNEYCVAKSREAYVETHETQPLSCNFHSSLGSYDEHDDGYYRLLPRCGGFENGSQWKTDRDSSFQFETDYVETSPVGRNTLQSKCLFSKVHELGFLNNFTGILTGMYQSVNRTNRCQCFRLNFDRVVVGFFENLATALFTVDENGVYKNLMTAVSGPHVDEYTNLTHADIYFSREKPFHLLFRVERHDCPQSNATFHLLDFLTTVAFAENNGDNSLEGSTTVAPDLTTELPTMTEVRTTTSRPRPITATTDQLVSSNWIRTTRRQESTPGSPVHPSVHTTLVEILQTPETSRDWFLTSPNRTLDVMQELQAASSPDHPIHFQNVAAIARIVEMIVQFTPSGNVTNPYENFEVITEVISVIDGLLEWDQNNLIDNISTGVTTKPDEVATKIYGALDNLANLIVATENSTEPVLIVQEFVAVSIFKKLLTAEDNFSSLKIHTTVGIASIDHGVPEPVFRAKHSSSVPRENKMDGAFISRHSHLSGIRETLFSLSVNHTALETEFLFIQGKETGGPEIFAVQLTSIKRFGFENIGYSRRMTERKARIASPVILMIGFHRPLSGIEKLITITGDPFALFQDEPCLKKFGNKKFGCVYLKYGPSDANVSAVWDNHGCRLDSPEHDRTLTWTCNHATPFAMVFDMCSSLKPLYRPHNDHRRMEPRVITTIGLSVSIGCLLVVLIWATWRLWKGGVHCTTEKFNQMNIYAALMLSNTAMLVTEHIPDVGNVAACLSSAVISHWLVLVAFGWMAVEYCRIFLVSRDWLKANAQREHSSTSINWKNRTVTATVIWFAPGLAPAICSAVHYTTHIPVYLHTRLWCWLDPHHFIMILPFFVVPVTLAAGTNVFVLVVRFLSLRDYEKMVLKEVEGASLTGLLSVTATCGLLAVSWLAGYFVLFACTDDGLKEFFAWFFVVLTATQGVHVLAGHLLTSPNVRRCFRKICVPADTQPCNTASGTSGTQEQAAKKSRVLRRTYALDEQEAGTEETISASGPHCAMGQSSSTLF